MTHTSNDTVLEHEILKILFTQTGFSITRVGTEARGMIPIYKRTYGHCILHYGTLVDVLNSPEKYKVKPEDSNSIFHWQEKVTRHNEIEIKNTGYYEVSDALELMSYNKHIEDTAPKSPIDEDISNRKISLTYEGVIAYLSGHYLKEYKKTQLEKVEEEKLNLDVDKLRNEYFDYPTTKFRAKWGFIISIITVILAALAVLVSLIKDKQ